jgi:putative endonuclease
VDCGGTLPGKSVSRVIVLGRAGEELAAAWYMSHGYEVVDRNWSCDRGELDIVARRGSLHVFCEVKTRSSEAFGLPAEAVGLLKQVRVRRLAARWFAERGGAAVGEKRKGGPVRFDVACVLRGDVEVIEAAF